jgi:hypothetical protein
MSHNLFILNYYIYLYFITIDELFLLNQYFLIVEHLK